MKSIGEHQAAFYMSQPVDYRRGWWKWALDQHNFMELVRLCVEDEPSVLEYRERAIAHYKDCEGK